MTRFALPSSLAVVLRAELPVLTRELAEAVADDFDPAVLRMGVEEALRAFVDEIELGRRPRERRVFVNFGRTEVRAGRPLERLLGAYRLGGRLAWRRFAAAGRAAGVEAEVLHALAEAIFAWIDELSDQSAAGYAQESRAVAGAAQARRERLVRLLVSTESPGGAQIEIAAAQVPWELPTTVVCCAVSDAHGRLLGALGGPGDLLAAPLGELMCVVAPATAQPLLERALARRELIGALGPPTAWRDAPRSWARATATHALLVRGLARRPDAGALVRAADHADLLVLAVDPALSVELRAAALAPLDALTARQRERFAATLLSWLAHRGALKEIAAELDIHPQTVRYRVGRLRELFGEALDDPDGRFRLELALRVP